jgi:prepilin-type N-terminal cleavage/methylation domain-containing protein
MRTIRKPAFTFVELMVTVAIVAPDPAQAFGPFHTAAS